MVIDLTEWRAALEHIAAGRPDPMIMNGIGYRPDLEGVTDEEDELWITKPA